MSQIPGPRYEFKAVEQRWLNIWDDKEAFSPEYAQKNRSPEQAKNTNSYSIVIPPPNVTGELHVGHALNQTMQDVSIRRARKQGYNTLWLPGTDHAGIATQMKVEQELKKEKTDRFKLGRKNFIKRVWEWKENYGNIITKQQRLMGFSLDWKRERFTMDAELSLAVRRVFVELYNAGLIYRSERMVNWDPMSRTVLSDLELVHEENYQGELYSFAYPLVENNTSDEISGEIIVATTRPETMLGDTGIAVHPDDKRYQHLIGKYAKHPFLARKIPIVADAELVDPEFGSGAVKITPAHDPNDFALGKRHNLKLINIFDEQAKINQEGGDFAGQDRYIARKAIKKALADLGLEKKSQAHSMSVARSQRSGVIVEPIVSTQWFVKMAGLAKQAHETVKSKEVNIIPRQWENTYFHWLDKIHDWCISRQLWWGHRIPAWYGPDEKIFVAEDEKKAQALALKHYKKAVSLRQDSDVLDTWFSSALWPFSTLGWPNASKDLSSYYPTTVLITGFDIIFFWVARMIMMGLHFMKKPPFKTVYIHGLMRDANAQKMSKTKGNVVEPLQVIQKYGTDAFRFFLMATMSEGKDSLYSEQRLKGYQNFSNKIWNSSRFVLMNLSDDFQAVHKQTILDLELVAEDYWILTCLNKTIKNMDQALDTHKYHLAADAIYSFFWHQFCDWYIELSKTRVFAKLDTDSSIESSLKVSLEKSKAAASQVLYYVLKKALGLLHPFMPFITEEIHAFLIKKSQKTKQENETELLISSPWPTPLTLSPKEENTANSLELLQEAIRATRLIRSQMGFAPDQNINIVLRSTNKQLAQIVTEKYTAIQRLSRASKIEVKETYEIQKNDVMETLSQGEVFVALDSIASSNHKEKIEKDKLRLEKELKTLEAKSKSSQGKLNNKQFIKNAPEAVINKEREKLAEILAKEKAIKESLVL